MTGKFPQVLDPVQIVGVNPHISFSQGMLGWQVQVAQSHLRCIIEVLFLPGGGMVSDNTSLNIEFRKEVVFISVLGVSLPCVAGLVVGMAEAVRERAKELGIAGRRFLHSSRRAQLGCVCLCTATKNSYLEPNCVPVVSSYS